MDKIIKGYYKDGVWHEYGGKLYDSIGYNTDGSITQKAISDSLGSVIELINGYKLAIRVHGDADCSNLHPFYFVNDGDSFTLTISYEKAGLALKINSIIMGEEDITTTAYDDGVITIDRVTDNVIINVEAASVTDTNMFTKRTTGNGITILNDKALLKGIKGNSCLWKQDAYFGGQVTYNNTALFTNIVKGSGTSAADIYYNAHYTGNGTGQINLRNTLTVGHIYILTITLKFPNSPTPTTTRFVIDQATSDGATPTAIQTYNVINGEVNITNRISVWASGTRLAMKFTYGSTSPNNWIPAGQSGIDFQFRNVNAFDLTAMFGAGNEPTTTEFLKLYTLGQYDRSTGTIINNSMTNYVSKDSNEETLQNVSLNVPTLTGKLNGGGDSLVIFPDGMKSTVCLPSATPTCLYKSDSKASYFDLDYVPTGQDVTIKCKIAVSSWISSAANLFIFRTSPQGENRYRVLRSASTDLTILAQNGANNYGRNLRLPGYSADATIELAFGSFTINGTTSALPTTIGAENTGTLRLFEGCNGKIYYFQVYKGEDLVVDCIPYRNGDVIGLQDRARNNRIFTLIQASGEGTMSDIEPTYEELPDPIYDEIKQDNGVWKAYKRISDVRVTNSANTDRGEYAPLAQEEVYVLDDQTIPTEITVANQGAEEILPTNGTTPVTAPTIMEIQYGSIPQNNLLGGGLLGGMLGGSNNGGSDDEEHEEEEPDYEEEVGEEEPEESEN